MKNKVVLITGGSGFLGRNIVAALAEGSTEYYYTYRAQTNLLANDSHALNIDLADPHQFERYRQHLSRVTHLVHTATTVTHQTPSTFQEDTKRNIFDNLAIASNLVSWLPCLEKIINISSCSVEFAMEDATLYGLGKSFVEQYLKYYSHRENISCISLRFPQLYGPGEPHGTFVSVLTDLMKRREDIELENGGAVKRDVLYIGDAVGCIQHCLERNYASEVATVTDEEHTVREVVKILQDIFDYPDSKIKHIKSSNKVIEGKSMHFRSSASSIGYNLRYNLRAGLELTAQEQQDVQK